MTTTLLELSKETMINAQKQDDFTIDDFSTFSDILNQINSIEELNLKPYLIVWNMNTWGPFYEFIVEALSLLGYENVGNMDFAGGKYKFNSNDDVHDRLFRFKDKNCDYTVVKQII